MYTLSQPKLNIRSLRCDTSSPHIFKIYKYIAHKICQSQCAAIFASLIARPYVFAFVFVCTRFISHSVALTPNYSFRIDWCSVLALCVCRIGLFLFFLRKKVDSFSIVVFGFAYCLCGFVEWIHHPFGAIYDRQTPEKHCSVLAIFFVSSTSLLIKDGYSFRFSCPIWQLTPKLTN